MSKQSKVYANLQDVTHHESGAVEYADGTIWIGNWSNVNGIPRELAPLGTIGLGEDLTAKKCAVPQSVKRAMQDHEREQGTEVSQSGFKAWCVNDTVVVIQDDWA